MNEEMNDETTLESAKGQRKLPRPKWSFSGKRGKPVHEREAENAIPAELKAVVDKLVDNKPREDKEEPATKLSFSKTEEAIEKEAAQVSADVTVDTSTSVVDEPKIAEVKVDEVKVDEVKADEIQIVAEEDWQLPELSDIPDPVSGLESAKSASSLLDEPVIAYHFLAPEPEVEESALSGWTNRDFEPEKVPSQTRLRKSLSWVSDDNEDAYVQKSRVAKKQTEEAIPSSIRSLETALHTVNTSKRRKGAISSEPRVLRRRSIARRAELDSVLAELYAVVDSSTDRRSS